MNRANAKTFARRSWLLVLAVLATVLAISAITWQTHPGRADGVDCSGMWWDSTDPIVLDTCSKQKASSNLPEQELATVTAQPYYQTIPNYTPVVMLPEPTEVEEVREVVYNDPNDPDRGAPSYELAGATSVWRDGAVPEPDYTMWYELYILSRPGNGAQYTQPHTGEIVTINTNPTLETMLFDSGGNESKYVKQWTCPNPVGALYITNITNPNYSNTNPSNPYPGLQSVVYFKTTSGQTGKFDMASETWTFNPLP